MCLGIIKLSLTLVWSCVFVLKGKLERYEWKIKKDKNRIWNSNTVEIKLTMVVS